MFVLLLAAFVVGLVGCGDSPTVPNSEAGVQQMSSTVPPEVRELLEQHADFGTETPAETLGSKSTFPEPCSNDYDVYAVTFLWGRLANVPVQSDVITDWSGKLSANAEVLIDVRFTIDFEPGQDSLIPVSSPTFAAWVSHTGFDLDGISFLVYLKRGNAYFAPPVLVFETAPITLRLPFHLLEHYMAYYPVDNGQGVAVLARRVWHGTCPSGALRGEWIRENNTSDHGTFNGLWLDNDGNITGIYSGRFWTNNDGTREFSGWVSGYVTDQVIAELKGRWRYDDPRLCPVCGDDHGWFWGKVRFLDNSGVGVLKGEFGDFTGAVDQIALPMVGVWKMICPFTDASSTTPVSQ